MTDFGADSVVAEIAYFVFLAAAYRRGDLSVVGPRPEQPRYVEELTDKLPFYPPPE